jgi:hypothetical protein
MNPVIGSDVDCSANIRHRVRQRSQRTTANVADD